MRKTLISNILAMLAILILGIGLGGCGEEADVKSDSSSGGASTTATFYATQDLAVESFNPTFNQNFAGSTCCELRISTDVISFADFDLSSLSGKTISSATLYLTKWSFDSGTDDVYARLSEIVYDELTATWNSVGGVPVQVGPAAQFVTMNAVSTPFGVEATELVQYFTQNLGTVKGFVIYQTLGQSFLQARETGIDLGPYLTVTYN